MKTIRVTLKPDYESGGRKSWFKQVTAVDRTKKDGYAFEGEFIPACQEVELPVGAVIIEQEHTGSVKNPGKRGNVYIVRETPDSNPEIRNPHLEFQEDFNWKSQFLSFRDSVAALLEIQTESDAPAEPAEAPDLMGVKEAIASYRAKCTSEEPLFELIRILQEELDNTRTFKL